MSFPPNSDASPADPSPSSSTSDSTKSDSTSAATPPQQQQQPLAPSVKGIIAHKKHVDAVIAEQLEQMQAQADSSLSRNKALHQYSVDPTYTSLQHYSECMANLTARQYYDFAKHSEAPLRKHQQRQPAKEGDDDVRRTKTWAECHECSFRGY